MKSKSFLLLKTLLKSTGSLNAIKYSNDKKRKNKYVGTVVGQILINLMIVIYVGFTAVGLGYSGMSSAMPALSAEIICMMAFFLAIFKTNGYMFAFKEYDMLMSMPFPVSSIVTAKFMYMYINTLSWVMTISVSVMAVYGFFERPGILTYVLWILLSLIIPLFPMVVAAAIGALVAGIGSGFRYKKAVQIVLIFVVVLPLFFVQYFVEALFKENELTEVVGTVADIASNGAGYYPPAKWFGEAVINYGISDILLLAGLSLLSLGLFVLVVQKYYRQINSKLMTSYKSRKKGTLKYKKRNIVVSIALKEFKRLTGSTTYAVNGGMGFVITAILGIIGLFVSGDAIVSAVTHGAPVSASVVIPAIPLIVYFMVGMVATTAISPSIEGKNYWIIKTMPVDNMTIFKGKMLFNFLLFGPVAMFATLTLCISFKAGVVMTLLSLVEICALVCMSTTWGLVCGVKHMKLNWENEIEVVKQGAAVSIYLLPNMFGTMILATGSIALGFVIPGEFILLQVTAIALIITAVCLLVIKRLAKKNI